MALLGVIKTDRHDRTSNPFAILSVVNGNDDGQENTPSSPSSSEPEGSTNHGIIRQYLLERVPEFRKLTDLRKLGWEKKEGDAFFAKQRRDADNANMDEKTAMYFYYLMRKIAYELQVNTGNGALRISPKVARRAAAAGAPPPSILDMCAAPGGFLDVALSMNPGAHAVAFSLPESLGGHRMLLPQNENVTLKFLDVTMLAADMMMDDDDETTTMEIPADHPDKDNFIMERQLQKDQLFDLVLCDGQVLRTHKDHRAEYRERREASRLTLTQLAMGLEHLRPGGTLIALLHKLEAWDTLFLLRTFNRFSRVYAFKPRAGHAKRSSFYLVATGVRSCAPEALRAVKRWKEGWRVATFGDEEEYKSALDERGVGVESVLEEFGERFIELGRRVWDIQATALEDAPFMKGNRNGGRRGERKWREREGVNE